jgi:Fic family protein
MSTEGTHASPSVELLEAENGLKQFDLAIDVIRTFLEPDRPFALRPSLIQELQSVAVKGLRSDPGLWRTGSVAISKSRHEPPAAHLVPFLVTEMCDYVNNNLHERTAFHLAAYIMWRLNWIHPFADGNGRTSRTASYIVLNVKLSLVLPGTPAIPEQIQQDRSGYFHALEAADAAFLADETIDVSQMENLLREMLAKQLLSVIEKASGAAFSH